MKAMILKRTFEASQHPKGSTERARLNEEAETSEYMTSERYLAVLAYPETETHTAYTMQRGFRTKREAQEYINSKS